jgi:thymidine phosphorylase
LDENEIEWIVRGFAREDIPDYQMSVLLMAITTRECYRTVGLVIRKKRGDAEERGEPVFETHARCDIDAQRAVNRIEKGLTISDRPVLPPNLFL